MIVKKELPTYPADCHWACQPKACFDEETMLEWIEVILKPYVALAPPHIVPIVLLDSFKVHMVGSVSRAIQALGAEVKFIPPAAPGSSSPST
jgi:hypothetical protein